MAANGTALSLGSLPAITGLRLTDRYDEALRFARILHASQHRKTSGAPYLSHLLSVSALVLEYGGDEAQATAALLHDAIEDQAPAFGGADKLRGTLEARFGTAVLHLVDIASDCEGDPKPPWRARKEAMVERLSGCTAYECLVPACDKLHNLRGINSDLRAGRDPFASFKAGPEQQLWYFTAMAAIYDRLGMPVAADLLHEVVQLKAHLTARLAEAQDEGEALSMP